MSVVTLHTAEYAEIVRRLDRIAELQKQILFAAQARDPKPKRNLPPRNGQPWTEEEKREVKESREKGEPLKDIAAQHERTAVLRLRGDQ